jgi:hypothetical protein
MFIFSGRGGVAMAPLEENGSIWVFDPSTSEWSLIIPSDPTCPVPPARSYHALTNDGVDILYLHAGCPASGRLSDLWSFHLPTRCWRQLSSAPDPPRGGTSIAFSCGRLYRMNGFDGKNEQGGCLDVYEPETDGWTTLVYHADGVSGPEPRSVSALLAVKVQGRESLVTLFGERDPSALGHQGAGKMLVDVWIWDVQSKAWREVQVRGNTSESGALDGDDKPCARGWFAADCFGEEGIVVQGGLGESNERLGDVWLLEFSSS